MAPYQLASTFLDTPYILRTEDNAMIPIEPENADYQAYLAWVAEGNTAEPSA